MLWRNISETKSDETYYQYLLALEEAHNLYFVNLPILLNGLKAKYLNPETFSFSNKDFHSLNLSAHHIPRP